MSETVFVKLSNIPFPKGKKKLFLGRIDKVFLLKCNLKNIQI